MATTDTATAAIARHERDRGRLSVPMAQPGVLRAEAMMILQTPHAKSLVEGRRGARNNPGSIGLMNFGRRLRQIWMSAEADDPYADWYLVKVEDALQEAKRLIGEKTQWLKGLMSGMEGFSINVAESLQPIDVKLSFHNPYGYIGAYAIHDYDVLVRMIYTAKHIGLLDRGDADKVVADARAAIRRAFLLATQWKFTGVTRNDLRQGNDNALRAIKSIGECPHDIMLKKRRAEKAPVIRQQTASSI